MVDIGKIKELPKTPGVYRFLDKEGNILYVGKAKSLKNRIKSYFVKEIGRGPTIDLMVSEAFDIKCIETESEIEAILLEAELINKLKPKYNVRLRDDKSFLVIKISKPRNVISTPQELRVEKSLSEKISRQARDDRNYVGDKYVENRFPCVELVRFKNVDFTDKSAWYFGPYPAGLLLKKSIRYLRKIFPFRDCSRTKFWTYKRMGRPCIYGDIKVCTAPCVEWIDEKNYFENIKLFMDFLKGKKKNIARILASEMKQLSHNKKYEDAAKIRDRLNALEHIKDVAVGIRDDFFNGYNILFPRIECYDISNILGQYAVGAMVVSSNGKKDSDEYRKFKIKFSNGANDLLMLKEMLVRRFNNDWLKPDLIVIDGGQNQLNVAKEVLKKMDSSIPVVSIAKGAKRDKNEFHFSDEAIAKIVMKDIALQKVLIATRDESHRFAIAYYRSLHKKGIFK